MSTRKKRTTPRIKKDGTVAKAPGRKPKELMSSDVYGILEDMVNKAVARLYPEKDPILAKKAPAEAPKLAPTAMPKNAMQARIMFEGTKSPLDIPNPDPDKFYYWVSQNPFDQQRAQINGFTFLVGKDECIKLGYDPITFLNTRHRINYLDVELAWCPKSLADQRRDFMRQKTKDRIERTTEAFKREAEKFGKIIEEVTVSAERVNTKGGLFTTDAE